MTDWHEIWNKRTMQGLDQSEDVSLQDLIFADGFDTGAGKINSDDWVRYIRVISENIDLAPGDSVFEIGCGSGAFLYVWYTEGHVVGGIDYSGNLISFAKKVMKGMDFRVSEAIEVDTAEKYDIVLSNSVFQYFKDYTYAEKVIERMITKAEKTIAILEVPDLAKKEESETARRGGLPEYATHYKGLEHLYYEKGWFTRFSDKFGYKIEISDQDFNNYGNSRFRFNVVIKK